MSNDQPRQPQRYSRFNRQDIAPAAQSAEPSLEEITTRALHNQRPAPARGLQRETPSPRGQQPLPSARQSDWLEPAPRHAPAPLDVELNPRIRREPPAASIPPAEARAEEPAPVAAPMPAPTAPAAVVAAVKPASETPAAAPKPTASAALQQGQNAAARVAEFTRSTAAPVIANGALWLAHNLRRRELRKRYGEALVFAHNRLIDRRLEQLFFVPTLKAAVTNPAPERGILYDGPVPSAVFNWALTAMPANLREYAFVDFRAGRGRTMLLAAGRNFERVIGFEYDAGLFDDLQMNISQYPRSEMACRNIDCFRGDLDGIRIPNQPCVLYFSGAWREQMLSGIMDHVRQTYQQDPRRIYIVLENADESVTLQKDDIFFRVEPPASVRAKLKLLSPMEFQFYRTTV